ncbi:fibronectin type III domain-containing protein [Actinospica durhamensis]|uniref:alpha-amylase n=1 Tax=Actinospica durhamensis TaxID=1508375 RepID=A0A941EP58_9ACTN|nr:glycoside hydrolase family 15 protein [Actinospica durhamensis]MBR7834811.1 fibronectin type III domain-containing protein [Actinospica durhamensis]
MASAPRRRRQHSPLISVSCVLALTAGLLTGVTAAASAATASGGPGSTPYWNESGGVQGFADSTSSTSKVAYTIGDGELENAFYPEDDEPDTYGLQYYVTNGSSFTDSEVSNTTHAVTLADSTSLTWQQTNTATNGDFSITKTYIADPNASVILIQTTFTNETSSPLYLYADYQPYLDNQGDGNTGGTDSTSGDLEAVNGSVASALAASTGFTGSSTGYVGTSSSGATELTSGYGLATTYSGVSSSGHLDQTAQIPVSSSGSTTFTLALAFDTTESSAITDAATALGSGFSTLESSFESGWHSWLAGLSAPPASVEPASAGGTGSAALLNQYYISLMELKADEDKTYVGGFVASPTDPWGASDSAASAGNHGYHLVWTRDEYEMASALLASGDSTDAAAALQYILKYEIESSGEAKQNTWLNGNQEWSGQQMDESADPLILAYQLGDTSSTDWATLKTEANYIVSNGPYTGQDRWEENSGYSPSTIAAEIAGLVCAYSLATTQGDTSDAATYLSTAKTWASEVDGWTYTTDGSLGSGSYFVRIAPNGTPNDSNTISISNGGGSYDQRAVVDAGFLELVRLGIKSASATDITNSLSVVDSTIGVTTPQGLMYHRYNHDGYGETSTGADYTGAGVGNLWPVFNGERGEYDIADGATSGAESQLEVMQASASADGQISEQVWGSSTAASASGTGWSLGQPDNSATPLMWSMAQYVRLADDISHGSDADTPAIVCQTFSTCAVSAPAAPTGLTVTAKTSSTVSLSWTASSGATGYKVLRNGTSVATPTSTSYTDTGLTAGTSYTYTVEATNTAGSSAASSSVTATTNSAGTAPNAPTGLTVGTVTTTTVPLSWTASSTGGSYAVAGYYVLRNGSVVGTTTSTSYTDTGLSPATAYTYTVEAYDTNGDVSAASSSVSATTSVGYTETFDVTVPVNTAASGDGVYLDGDFSVLGQGGSDWAASGLAMTKVDDTHYTLTVSASSAASLQYKYVLGASWNNVEETASCGYVANRSVTVGGTETDTVADWAGPNTCGNAQAVIDVTVPSSTPSGDEVYISGDFSALGIGMSSANDWTAGLYPMTKIAANQWQILVPSNSGDTLAYKFDLNGTWTNVEEGSSCAYVNNRSFLFNGADSSYTASDSVLTWAGLNGC